jgi:hypothetical protein
LQIRLVLFLYLTTFSVGKQSSNYLNFQHFEQSAADFLRGTCNDSRNLLVLLLWISFLFFSGCWYTVFLIEKAKSFEWTWHGFCLGQAAESRDNDVLFIYRKES